MLHANVVKPNHQRLHLIQLQRQKTKQKQKTHPTRTKHNQTAEARQAHTKANCKQEAITVSARMGGGGGRGGEVRKSPARKKSGWLFFLGGGRGEAKASEKKGTTFQKVFPVRSFHSIPPMRRGSTGALHFMSRHVTSCCRPGRTQEEHTGSFVRWFAKHYTSVRPAIVPTRPTRPTSGAKLLTAVVLVCTDCTERDEQKNENGREARTARIVVSTPAARDNATSRRQYNKWRHNAGVKKHAAVSRTTRYTKQKSGEEGKHAVHVSKRLPPPNPPSPPPHTFVVGDPPPPPTPYPPRHINLLLGIRSPPPSPCSSHK